MLRSADMSKKSPAAILNNFINVVVRRSDHIPYLVAFIPYAVTVLGVCSGFGDATNRFSPQT